MAQKPATPVLFCIGVAALAALVASLLNAKGSALYNAAEGNSTAPRAMAAPTPNSTFWSMSSAHIGGAIRGTTFLSAGVGARTSAEARSVAANIELRANCEDLRPIAGVNAEV